MQTLEQKPNHFPFEIKKNRKKSLLVGGSKALKIENNTNLRIHSLSSDMEKRQVISMRKDGILKLNRIREIPEHFVESEGYVNGLSRN